ncbi:hypothetical protein DIPPA_22948 [Diplonema papillatum]|nr:hypothetical protein DIPPA_21157 [Diplonema papillatum]KAJ9453963.1 hypothetical protein DIPPA_22948 [Diplonema papillatum]
MHTVASTAAGHPEYVDGQYAVSSDVVVHVWVDNIRYAGPHDLVLAVTSRLDELASEAGMTWKAADTQTAAQRYEFIGVEWNHADGTVGVSRKMRSRLQRAEDAIEGGSMTASDVESLAGRLLHASAITGVFVGEFYFVLKFFRRVTNALNRGEKAVDEKVVLSGGIRRSLPVWLRRVARRRAVPVAAQTPELAVFVDASLDGWGGVLVDVDTNDMVVVGARWKRAERRFHINELEAMALERSVAAITPAHAGSTVSIVVDNTSVQGVARKGSCLRSQVLNDSVVRALLCLQRLNIAFSVRWVKSAGNPADLPSRVPVTSLTDKNIADISLAVRDFLTGEMGLVA